MLGDGGFIYFSEKMHMADHFLVAVWPIFTPLQCG